MCEYCASGLFCFAASTENSRYTHSGWIGGNSPCPALAFVMPGPDRAFHVRVLDLYFYHRMHGQQSP